MTAIENHNDSDHYDLCSPCKGKKDWEKFEVVGFKTQTLVAQKQTKQMNDRHIYIDSEGEPDQENVYFIGSENKKKYPCTVIKIISTAIHQKWFLISLSETGTISFMNMFWKVSFWDWAVNASSAISKPNTISFGLILNN